MKKKIRKLFQTSIINTLRINYHYFGLQGILCPYILMSKNTKINILSGNCLIKKKQAGIVQIGYGYVGVIDSKYQRSLWENTGTIIFEGKTKLGVGTRICCMGGSIHFGNNFTINANTGIISAKKISFGDNCLISWDCLIMDTDFHHIYNIDNDKQMINENKEISIGNKVWIGCKSLILKGSEISDNTVVAAGSVVTKKSKRKNIILVNNDIKKENIMWRD